MNRVGEIVLSERAFQHVQISDIAAVSIANSRHFFSVHDQLEALHVGSEVINGDGDAGLDEVAHHPRAHAAQRPRHQKMCLRHPVVLPGSA